MVKIKHTMQNQIIIIGAGSVGGHVAVNMNLYFDEELHPIFLDDDSSKHGKEFCGIEVLGSVTEIKTFSKSTPIVVGIAFPKVKQKIIKQLQLKGYTNFPKLISKRSWVSNNVEIGAGCIIYPGCSINYGSKIREFVVMNMNCAIGHDCLIQDFVSISPGVNLGGNTRIGQMSEVGIGASTLQSIKIGHKSIVGGSAMVTKSFPHKSKIKGVPAK